MCATWRGPPAPRATACGVPNSYWSEPGRNPACQKPCQKPGGRPIVGRAARGAEFIEQAPLFLASSAATHSSLHPGQVLHLARVSYGLDSINSFTILCAKVLNAFITLVRSFSPTMSDRKAVIKNADMSEEMQQVSQGVLLGQLAELVVMMLVLVLELVLEMVLVESL